MVVKLIGIIQCIKRRFNTVKANTNEKFYLSVMAYSIFHINASSHFRITFVITHGYLEHGKKDWLVRMKDELLIHGNHNVIVLSWLGGSRYTQKPKH